MITEKELRSMLTSLGFSKKTEVYTNNYKNGASIKVDFSKKRIIYNPIDKDFAEGQFPTKEKPANGFVIHRDTTLNFSANENFVCLVCVHFLLEKGYEAKHIVFEPAFKVGHVNKPSYGDILVFDKEYNPLVLIENKTFGTEFSKEWNLMQKDGGQLFSYLGPLVNEMGLCENLVLFAADYDDKDLILKSHIITLKDNEKRVAELENPTTFADAHGKYFEVWSETYGKSFETKGLFEEDIAPYTIGKLKYTIKDLKGLSHAEIKPIYHEFATILRNNAITDFEHSFYILIDLFLCKITDELNNPNDLQFYYKGVARDTPKEYCGRLLKLYQQGKKQLFDVDVINKEEDDIKQIFEDTNRSITNGLFAGIKELFEEIKFYNIKKFNFIDVENKEEFEMNFQILIKIAALIQDINLSSSETNHFFGDLFEGLLSKNVHQTEGQFFTPLPIVNFIIRSLPEFPEAKNIKVLDYSCGAGHFLTEFIKQYPKAEIFGIEKSQTLSQVAKIATIINGSKDSRIVYNDALSYINSSEARFVSFDKDSFDCIIANPPYSVKGFLETLDDKDRRQFDLTNEVDEKAYSNNNSIECFFIERSKHYLKSYGLMGIILPSSLLSNEGIYVKTREILFANFNILAIVFMNSRTFGSTGTNTIILFAQKVGKNAEGLLDTFIAKKDYKQYLSWEEIDNYISKQGYEKDDFFAFMQDNVLEKRLAENEVFVDYYESFTPQAISKQQQKEWFKESTLFKNDLKERSKEYAALMKEFLSSKEYHELEKEQYVKQFIAFAKTIECEKLKTFIHINSNKVAVLQSPPDKVKGKTNKKEIIRFLGYDWSNRKGDEGIKYITDRIIDDADDEDEKDSEVVKAINSIKYIKTPLYNPKDADDSTKFSYALRKHINENCTKYSFGPTRPGSMTKYDGDLQELISYRRLSDLIDFRHTVFDKKISISNTSVIDIKSKWPSKRIEKLLVSISGNKTKIPQEQILDKGQYPVVSQNRNSLVEGYTNNKSVITDLPLIVFGDHSCAVKYIDFPFVRGADGTQLVKVDENELKTKYLYYYLSIIQIENADKYERHFKYLKATSVPIPPIDIQEKIIKECISEDAAIESGQRKIGELIAEINTIVSGIRGKQYKLGKIADFKNGVNYDKSSVGETIDIVGVSDFKDNKSPDMDRLDNIVADGILDDSYLLHKNDLLTVRSNGSQELVGRFIYIDKEPNERTTYSGFTIRVRPDNKIVISELLYYLLSTNEVRRKLTTGSNGANIKSLNQTLLSNVKILIPDITEQKATLSKLRKIEKRIKEIKTSIEAASERKREIIVSYLT